MKEHYVSFEQAQSLKQLGFDWEVRGYYTRDDNFQKAREVTALNHNDTRKFKNILSAPRLDQAAAWLRDKGIHISLNPYSISPDRYDGDNYFWSFELFQVPAGGWLKVNEGGFDTYELALSAGISNALELLGKEDKE